MDKTTDALTVSAMIWAFMNEYAKTRSHTSCEFTHRECKLDVEDNIESVSLCAEFIDRRLDDPQITHAEYYSDFAKWLNQHPKKEIIKKCSTPVYLGFNYTDHTGQYGGHLRINFKDADVAQFIERPDDFFVLQGLNDNDSLWQWLKRHGFDWEKRDAIEQQAWDNVIA